MPERPLPESYTLEDIEAVIEWYHMQAKAAPQYLLDEKKRLQQKKATS